ncbi:MAG: transglycosylase SLT domain-containing protein [Moraxellaceae bacterium]
MFKGSGLPGLLWLALVIAASGLARADSKDDFLAARDALRQGNLQIVAEKAEALSQDPLGIYPRYWLLSAQIDLVSPDHILPFLKFYQGSWLAEKLRGEWLRALGKKGEWPLFREQYPLLVDEPSTELLCYSYQSRLAADDKRALTQARAALWFSAKDLPGSCNPVLGALLQSATVSQADIRDRLRIALEANEQEVARHLADLLGVPWQARDLQKLVAAPAAWLKKPAGGGRLQSELAIFAIGRLARTDDDAALAELQNWQGRFSDNQKLYAWRRLAQASALQHEARAPEWFARSEGLPWTDFAVEWRARLALRVKDWDAVLAALRQLSEEKQKERGWQYWQARALEAKAGDAKKPGSPAAAKIYAQLSADDDYYGLLARERLGPVLAPAASAFRLIDEDWRRAEANAGLQRALRLNEMDLRTEATREWNWALRGADDRMLLVAAETASRAGWYDRAIYAAERTKKLHNYELRYLAPYRDVVRDYAQQTGLDEAWVYGLMRQESRFVSAARSGVGAGGLMQLMPSTARWVAGKVGLKYEPAMVNDAGTNVRLGTYYLRHVLDELSSQPVLATAAYNAGPNRARAWQPADNSMEAELYIESIPFSETRDYVKKVMTNAVHYAQAFGQPQQTLLARIGTIPPRNLQVIEGP